jgi:hypothetical protein
VQKIGNNEGLRSETGGKNSIEYLALEGYKPVSRYRKTYKGIVLKEVFKILNDSPPLSDVLSSQCTKFGIWQYTISVPVGLSQQALQIIKQPR